MLTRSQLIELARERWRRRNPGVDAYEHAAVAMAWLQCAQDAGEDRGVAYGYELGRGWLRSYPETTGYIVPTFLNWMELAGDVSARQRALEMADWEIEGQLASGAIPNLTGGEPTIFDTGQVIFGWVAAHQSSQDERYLHAARRGGDWLVAQQDGEEIWQHGADAGGPGRVYNVRTAWALLELHAASGDVRYAECARRFLDWALRQERDRGWFDRNCLTQDAAPLLHTIAYTARGLLESGRLLEDDRLVEAAQRTADALLPCVRADGWMPGRFDPNWNGTVRWSCLTGEAQIAIVWRRLAHLGVCDPDRSGRYLDAAARVGRFLRSCHDRSASNPGLRGGVRGSYPVQGAYGRWRVLNWATKFFVDLMMCELRDDALRYKG